MKNFFIPDVSPAQKKMLQDAAVAFCEMELDGQVGLVVDQDSIARALAVFGAEVASETVTSIEGIVKVSVKGRGDVRAATVRASTVTVESWNGMRKKSFAQIAEEILLSAVMTDIVLHVPHQCVADPAGDGKFHIWIWSAPSNCGRAIPPEKIWEFTTDCRDEGYLPSGRGVPIVDARTGWAVGELVGNNLYIHHDLCHSGTDQELKIFRHLCEEVVTALGATPEEKADRQRKLAEAKRVASRAAYVKECSRRLEKTVAGTREAVTEGHEDIARLQQELTKRIRETRGAEKKLEQLSACKGVELEKYEREYDALLQVGGVEWVEVSEGVIRVFTEHIYITPDRCADTFDIGKFRMEIYTAGNNGGIRFFNVTRQGKGGYRTYNRHHPHVNAEGEPCLGNIKEMVPTLIGEAEYSAVAQIGLQFLKSVNTTDDQAGPDIFSAWPKKEREVVNV